MTEAEIGVIGGSGLYALLEPDEEVAVDTPYGSPSARLVLATVGARRVAFLPRHGVRHDFPPHRVPYRANLWALRHLGVRQVLAPCAVGGLEPSMRPGDLVVPDQILDTTGGRPSTYYDASAVHVPFADPYCPRLREQLLSAASEVGWPARDGGTTVVINGPRFATRAESRRHAAAGGTVINMTGMPEAVLARELALCYATLALVTDLDSGVTVGETVTQQEVFGVFAHSIDRLRTLLLAAVAALPLERSCPCPQSLVGTPAENRA